jgi:hypothetical protein
MPELCTFDYAIIRVVPRVEREEFINVGVILSCPDRQFLKARLDLNVQRLAAFAPSLDAETIRGYLNTISIICDGGSDAGAIGQLPQRARFHWLVAPRSTIIQTSHVHSGFCEDPEATLEHLLEKMVRLN